MKHTDTYAYARAKEVLDNEYDLQMAVAAIGKQGLNKAVAVRRVARAAAYMIGYTDYDCPPISRRSIKYWAIETVEDWQ
jgi:hypothetical protein